MLIRSQNKERLFFTENMAYIDIEESEDGKHLVCAVYPSSISRILGEYDTKEQALDVEGKIEEKYGGYQASTGGQLITQEGYVPPFAFNPPKVFQMPPANEVTSDE